MTSKVPDNLKGKKIAILGFGKEGESLLKFLFRAGVRELTVLDQKEKLVGGSLIEKLGVKCSLGKNYLKNIGDFDLIFRSPGVPLTLLTLGPVRSRLSSPTKLFFELCPTSNVIGVTGTKGKSTTASLIHQILKQRFKRTFLAGNLGTPMLDLLPRLRKRDWVVLELSSFQLEDLTASPRVAVLLNITPEHLYRHGNLPKYIFAKSTIFRYQKPKSIFITNYDHFVLRRLAGEAGARVIFVSTKEPLKEGIFVEGGKIVSSLKRKQTVMELSEIPLRGKHNLENVLPAIACGLVMGVTSKKIADSIKHFRNLPHRLELVGERGRVLFIDDSIATTPEASLAGVESFTVPVALIAGGSSKKANFTSWAREIARNPVVYVSLIGDEAPEMEKVLKKYAPAVKRGRFSTLLQAVRGAYGALKGREGVVLLSPACASFDMFRDFADRGEQFKRIVGALK